MVLGVVGKIGSGKSVVIKHLQDKYGAISFSCDDIAKELIMDGKYKLCNSEQVFTDKNLQEDVRTNFHPLVFSRINENINNFLNKNSNLNKCEFLITIESALPNDDMYDMCDKMIYIDSPYEMRVSRLKNSRGYSDDKIKQIYDSQEYYEKFYDEADYKINNDGTKEELIKKIDEVINEIYIARK